MFVRAFVFFNLFFYRLFFSKVKALWAYISAVQVQLIVIIITTVQLDFNGMKKNREYTDNTSYFRWFLAFLVLGFNDVS